MRSISEIPRFGVTPLACIITIFILPFYRTQPLLSLFGLFGSGRSGCGFHGNQRNAGSALAAANLLKPI